ncbi:glycosyltransferase family 2 protein [Enterococcus sp. AZ072]|uniref:glycosyltransferase family 2 protein n=1 Tax=unclassified Enterococcus TaxID=2608891 RepID=UPI003D271979
MIPILLHQLIDYLNKLISQQLITQDSRIVLVDDGSTDRTWKLIDESIDSLPVIGLKFSRNFGHQYALLAGLMETKGQADIYVSIDADLQDDIHAIEEMIIEFNKGYEIVAGVRRERKNDTWFKRNTALFFYKFSRFLGIDMIPNHADFRLLSQRAVDTLADYTETNLFLRGTIPLMGYPTSKVYYDRKIRLKGSTKYSLKKMVALAFNGITSLSIAPMKWIRNLGFLCTAFGILYMVYVLILKLLGNTVQGWASLMITQWILSGFIMTAVGLHGEYTGKIYLETKKRPRYIIEERRE